MWFVKIYCLLLLGPGQIEAIFAADRDVWRMHSGVRIGLPDVTVVSAKHDDIRQESEVGMRHFLDPRS